MIKRLGKTSSKNNNGGTKKEENAPSQNSPKIKKIRNLRKSDVERKIDGSGRRGVRNN